MPITKTITLYKFSELPTGDAKQKAREWFLSNGDEAARAYEYIKDDAARIGLNIEYLGQYRDAEGNFIDGAFKCVAAIKAEHGKECETYKTAVKYEEAIDALPDDHGNLEEESRAAASIDELENDFLTALLEDYRVMWQREIEYQQSDEVVDESLEANGYTFTETGKRED